MAKIIEKHDNDKNYVFTCPVCGTVFTERERSIKPNYCMDGLVHGYILSCPNCEIVTIYRELKEYQEQEK